MNVCACSASLYILFFNLEEMDISSVMGFTGFGKPQKAARKFDLDAIFEKTKREAKAILSHNGISMQVCVLCVCAHARVFYIFYLV